MRSGQPRDLFGDVAAPKLSRGYAGHPGGGPEAETCGTCLHLVHWKPGDNAIFFKCGRIRWTHGEGTDIRKKTPACEYFQGNEGLDDEAMLWCNCPPRECYGLDKNICRGAINPRSKPLAGELCLHCGQLKTAEKP